jgi:hypothetical protein
MEGETSRRHFLQGGSLATAGVLAAGGVEAAQPNAHDHHAGHGEDKDFPRDHPGPGGPV